MDACMKELVAMGASAAANCNPCMEHHLAECDKLGFPRDEVLAAVGIGLMVSHGAESAIRKHTHNLLGEIAPEITT